MSEWTVLDTETTGFSPKSDRLIEFAASRFDPEKGKLLSHKLHLLINPKRSIPEEAIKVHGITEEHLKDKPVFSEVADEILKFVGGSILVIQNAPFDMGFLNAELERAGKSGLDKHIERVICARRLSNMVRPGKPASLDVLCDLFGVDRSARTLHGALIDCELLAAIYPHLARLGEEYERKIERVLPFARNEALPRDVRQLGNAHVALSTVIKTLVKEQERIEKSIEELIGRNNYVDRDFTVEFAADGVTTNYKKALKDNLPNLNLAAYQSPKKGSIKVKPI